MVQGPETDVRDPLPVRVLAGLLLAGTAYVACRRIAVGDFQYVVWSDRELARSHVPFFELPTAGAELSYGVGAGTPGGAIHLLLWVVSWVSASPHAAWLVQVGLDALAAGLLAWSGWRARSLLAGALAAAVFLSATPDVANQAQLWNPAFMSLFLAVGTVAWVRVVVAQDARALAPWAFALAIAAQMHVTAGVLALAMLPGVLLARAPRTGRGLLGAVAAALAAYGPYLIHEVRHGFPNMTQLLNPVQLEDLTQPVLGSARPLDNLVGALRTLGSQPTLNAMSDMVDLALLTPIAVVGPLLGVVGVVLAMRRTEAAPTRRLAVSLVAALAVGLIALARSRSYNFVSGNVSRYLIFLVPVVAVTAGLAGDTLVRATRARSVTLASSLAALLVLSTGVRLVAADALTTAAGAHPLAWSRLSRWLDAAQVDTGLPLPELVRRTTAVSWKYAQGWQREEAVPVDALLQAQGARFEGPAAPPCFAVFVLGHDDPTLVGGLTQDDLVAALGPAAEPPLLQSVAVLGPDMAIVRFTPETGLCPTNLVQRYRLTPEEQLTADAGATVPVNTARRLEDEDGMRRWLVTVETGPNLQSPFNTVYALVTARPAGDHTELVLHSNQLRGFAWNGGFFLNVVVRAPRLIARDATGAELSRVLFAPGLVGRDGMITPLHVAGALPSGATLVLAVDVPPFDPQTGLVVPGPGRTMEIGLPDGAP